MRSVVCPHCKVHRIMTAKMPREVAAIIPCPGCHELIVLFREKALALSRSILNHGTPEEKRDHLAGIIAEFIEPGMFGSDDAGMAFQTPHIDLPDHQEMEGLAEETPPPISDKEVERFIKVELRRLDDPAYFKRHFGA